MNNKDKGNIGEAIALAEFTKRNIQVSIPFGDNARYDLIAEFNGKLNKIQVKYCNQEPVLGSINCPCSSSTNHTTNKKYTTYQNDIDYFVFYIVPWQEILIVPIEIVGDRKSMCFRQSPPNTKQQKYNLVSDYSFSNFFDNDDKKEVFEKEKQHNYCIDCGIEISLRATRCIECNSKYRTSETVMPVSREELKQLIRSTSFTQIGLKYHVSDNAVRKWCDKYNLPRSKREINSYSDEEWHLK